MIPPPKGMPHRRWNMLALALLVGLSAVVSPDISEA
jgi:hypothetical protein